jgi:tetratricopeptide (TPR) repeat protein
MKYIAGTLIFLAGIAQCNMVLAGECDAAILAIMKSKSVPKERFSKMEILPPSCKKSGMYYHEMASELDDLGDLAGAIAILDKAVKDESVDYQFENLAYFASLILANGETDRALQIGKTLERHAPDERIVLKLLADVYYRKEMFAEAKKYAERSLAVNRENSSYLYPILIYSDYSIGDYKGAIDAFEDAIKRKVPDNILYKSGNAPIAVAHSYYILGRYAESASVLKAQIDRTPEFKNNLFVSNLISALKAKGAWG